jgi:hypothetical protein
MKFKIGNNTNYGQILHIGEDGFVQFKNDVVVSLHLLNKAEELFTTQDGKAILEGDEYWFVSLTNDTGRPKWSITRDRAMKGRDFKNEKLWIDFSTQEAAEEYVFNNKPCLSISEVASIGSMCGLLPFSLQILKDYVKKNK